MVEQRRIAESVASLLARLAAAKERVARLSALFGLVDTLDGRAGSGHFSCRILDSSHPLKGIPGGAGADRG